MSKPIRLSVNLPFAGFYDSKWSHLIDSEEEQFCEYSANEADPDRDDSESRFPEELRLDSGELAELLFRHTQYHDCYAKIASWYPDAFANVAREYLDLDLAFEFEEMTSPREYNFATDRIFATLPLATLKAFFAESKAEKHAHLIAQIAERFTSYDGFHSSYDNTLAAWLAKPLRDWDHNETATLLGAILAKRLENVGEDYADFEWHVYEAVSDDCGGYEAWSEGVDWPAFEAARAEARQDKRDDWSEAHPGEDVETVLAPPVDPNTLDLFEGLRP